MSHASTASIPSTAPSAGHHKALVIAARTALLMLLIAALVVLGLGVFFYLRGGEPEVDGWLRAIFGKVFLVVATGLAAFLGVPSVIGLWAMAGANKDDATPALPQPARLVFSGIGIATVIVTAIVLLATGSAITIINVGLLAIVGLAALGLAGAVVFSPGRGRAILAAIALVALVAATAWILMNAFISPSL